MEQAMKKKVILVLLPIAVIVTIVAVHFYMADRGRWATAAAYDDLASTVTDNELVSMHDPGVVMRFDPSFHYLGGQKFVLYGVADAEQHFFAEISDDDELKSVYWIQFEAYLPDNSYEYDYEDSAGRLQLNGFSFYVDAEPVQSNPKKRRRGTDGARARELLQSKGYTFPQDFTYARLVHLPDDSRRKELMIIFIEDLAPLGLKGSDLQKDGKAAERWPEIEKAHIEKIRSTMTLSATGD